MKRKAFLSCCHGGIFFSSAHVTHATFTEAVVKAVVVVTPDHVCHRMQPSVNTCMGDRSDMEKESERKRERQVEGGNDKERKVRKKMWIYYSICQFRLKPVSMCFFFFS